VFQYHLVRRAASEDHARGRSPASISSSRSTLRRVDEVSWTVPYIRIEVSVAAFEPKRVLGQKSSSRRVVVSGPVVVEASSADLPTGIGGVVGCGCAGLSGAAKRLVAMLRLDSSTPIRERQRAP
jgi:hypothetical protein